MLIVAHRRKSGGAAADDLALGSRAFTGIARATWHLVRDPKNKTRRLLLPGKNNLAREGDGLAFAIVGEPPRISWERDPVEMHADDALAEEQEQHSNGRNAAERQRAERLLAELLEDGPRLAAEATDELVNGHGLAKRTLARAREAVGVEAFRPTNPGPWWWRLKGDPTEPKQIGTGDGGNVAMCPKGQRKRNESEVQLGRLPDCQGEQHVNSLLAEAAAEDEIEF